MQKKICFLSFFLSIPIILYALILVLPTFDDWTYLTSPYFGEMFAKDRILPVDGYWRPFDAIIGSIVGYNYHLFPAFNHFIILLGHVGCTVLIYYLSKRRLLPAAFFFLSPGMLGSVLDIDSANQVYSAFWGLLALLFYTKGKKNLWIVSVAIATFCKENGIMYVVIPLILEYFSHPTPDEKKACMFDLMKTMAFCLLYGVVRLLLTPSSSAIKSDYLNASLFDHLKDIVQYVSFTWIPIDYEAIVFEPTRCLPLAFVSGLATLPFMLFLARDVWGKRRDKFLYALLACYFIVAAPHLLTLFSAMHTYSGLGLAALIIGYTFKTNSMKRQIAIGLFIVTSIGIDVHHWYATYKSGLVGKEMSESILSKYKKYPERVHVICVNNGEQKYSTFNVIPFDAFGWGNAAQYYSGYKCAMEVSSSTVAISNPKDQSIKQKEIKEEFYNIENRSHYDAIWLVDGKSVTILK